MLTYLIAIILCINWLLTLYNMKVIISTRCVDSLLTVSLLFPFWYSGQDISYSHWFSLPKICYWGFGTVRSRLSRRLINDQVASVGVVACHVIFQLILDSWNCLSTCKCCLSVLADWSLGVVDFIIYLSFVVASCIWIDLTKDITEALINNDNNTETGMVRRRV